MAANEQRERCGDHLSQRPHAPHCISLSQLVYIGGAAGILPVRLVNSTFRQIAHDKYCNTTTCKCSLVEPFTPKINQLRPPMHTSLHAPDIENLQRLKPIKGSGKVCRTVGTEHVAAVWGYHEPPSHSLVRQGVGHALFYFIRLFGEFSLNERIDRCHLLDYRSTRNCNPSHPDPPTPCCIVFIPPLQLSVIFLRLSGLSMGSIPF